MASIGKEPNGRKRILFVAADGSRKTVRIGKAILDQHVKFRELDDLTRRIEAIEERLEARK